jgi:hypothetical protein
MILRRRCSRWKRPARNQTWFSWFTAERPVYLDVLLPSRPRPRPPGYKVQPRVRRRAWDEPGRRERQVDRFVRRRAGCALCSTWPAPHDVVVGGRLLLLCKACAARPDSLTRLKEIVTVDWRPTPEPAPIGCHD